MKRGLIVFVALLLIVALAAAPSWFRYQSTRRIHALWGTQTLRFIARAPQAELLVLAVPTDNAPTDSVEIAGVKYPVVRRVDLAATKGATHLRVALGQDLSYEWEAPAATTPVWQLAILFRDDEGQSLVALDLERRVAWASGTQNAATLSERIAGGIKEFVADAASSTSSIPRS